MKLQAQFGVLAAAESPTSGPSSMSLLSLLPERFQLIQQIGERLERIYSPCRLEPFQAIIQQMQVGIFHRPGQKESSINCLHAGQRT